jgi:asparagine synthase (glutamine-hydrolysing)
MCGIVGAVQVKGCRANPVALRAAADVLYKRGPDDSGIWIENNVGLGHRRLAILDVTSAGHQPMVSQDGRYVIVHNGEIYNFRELRKELDAHANNWRSESDTEVILAAYAIWGTDCLKRFRGMFAFAIWDRREKALFAARDRMGVKPFYFHHSPGRFIFASRPRALSLMDPELSREIDEQALRFYLESGYVPAPHSIYRDVGKLPPAHYLLFDGKGLQTERYWEFRDIRPDPSWEQRSESDLLDELDELISRSVRLRMISDVPLGAFLSGGIDSSLVVAKMAESSSQPIKTFTIGFEEKDYDESNHAAVVARHLGTEHHCEHLKVNDLLDLMPIFLEEFDEPFFDSSAFPTMAVSRMTRNHVTVSLSGDGGDEMFGGYHYYKIAQYLGFFFKLPELARTSIASLVGMIPKHQLKLLSAALHQPDSAAVFAFSRSIAKDFHGVLVPEVLAHTKSMRELFGAAAALFPRNLSPAEQGMRLDAAYTLPDDYLQKVDVASMAFSLESRDPLLDHELVEWAMKLPLMWKLRHGQNKYLLRRLAYRYVPRKIIDRPKMGFGVPIDDWLRGPLKQWAIDRLQDKTVYSRVPLDQSKILALFDLHASGARNVHPLLWAVLMFIDFTLHEDRNTCAMIPDGGGSASNIA